MEEEIDLRPYIEAVTRNWMWVLGAMILAALIALGISLLRPATYRAKALVAVTEPRQVVQFDPRIKTTEDNQPIKAYPELATSDELLGILLEEVQSFAPEITTLSSLRGQLEAEAGSDPSLINMFATSGDPQIASQIVNNWAEIFVLKANEVFGAQGGEQQDFFEDQLSASSQDLQQAEQNLIEFQSRNRTIILDNELIALQQTQADQLAKQRQITLLVQDVESLQEQLTNPNDRNIAPATDQLASILLQLRAFGGVPNVENTTTPWQVQVNVGQISETNEQDQIAFLTSLNSTLAAQAQQINEHLAELEPQILSVQQDKQEATAEETRLIRDLTVAEETYTALARKVEEGKITSQNTGSGVRLASRSAVPEFATGPRKLFIVAGAAIAGMFIAVFIILVLTWWRA